MEATAVLDAREAPRSAEALDRTAWILAAGRVASPWVPEWLLEAERRALADLPDPED
jgi:hypothetical protein